MNIKSNCQSESESVDDRNASLFGSLPSFGCLPLGFLGSFGFGGLPLFFLFNFLTHAIHPGHPDLPVRISGRMAL